MELTIEQIMEDIKDSLVVDKSNDLYFGVALAGEVGEYLNFIKKENRTNGFRFQYKQETEDEIMDILYYIVAVGMTRDVNFMSAWNRKMFHNSIKYNRPVKRRISECDCEICTQWKQDHKTDG